MKIEHFKDLDCWKAARVLVRLVFEASRKGELARDYGTQAQLRRAALSAMNNIAEGFSRYHYQESINFYNISQGSAAEVHSMTFVLSDLEYLPEEEIQAITSKAMDTRNLTLGLIRYLRRRNR